MSRKPSITLIGAGNLASALAPALRRAGYRIDEIVSRPTSRRRALDLARKVGARPVTSSNARLTADVVWFCVNDDAIRTSATEYAAHVKGRWKGKIALHSSGALASDELNTLKRKGAAVGSIHPMMTFVAGRASSMNGVAFALEGDSAAVQAARLIALKLGGHPFEIRKEDKVLYHAIGAFCSPLIVALLTVGEEVARQAQVPPSEIGRVMHPILRRTVDNYIERRSTAAFSGPINRGDLATVRKHLAALKKVPVARRVYLDLARVALHSLPVKNKTKLERILNPRLRNRRP